MREQKWNEKVNFWWLEFLMRQKKCDLPCPHLIFIGGTQLELLAFLLFCFTKMLMIEYNQMIMVHSIILYSSNSSNVFTE